MGGRGGISGLKGGSATVIPENISPLVFKFTNGLEDMSAEETRALQDFVEGNATNMGTLYRGLDLTDNQLKALKVGESLKEDERLTSYSKDFEIAQDFSQRNMDQYSRLGHNPVIVKEKNGKGVDITGHSKYSSESEVIVSAKGAPTITKIEEKTGSRYGYRGQKESYTYTVVTVDRKKRT